MEILKDMCFFHFTNNFMLSFKERISFQTWLVTLSENKIKREVKVSLNGNRASIAWHRKGTW